MQKVKTAKGLLNVYGDFCKIPVDRYNFALISRHQLTLSYQGTSYILNVDYNTQWNYLVGYLMRWDRQSLRQIICSPDLFSLNGLVFLSARRENAHWKVVDLAEKFLINPQPLLLPQSSLSPIAPTSPPIIPAPSAETQEDTMPID